MDIKTIKISDLVLYKNNQLIAFNKPATIPVQEDKTGDKALINLAEIFCKSKLRLVHRIDRPATGVVLFAKTDSALARLNELFRERAVEKTYLAVVKDLPEATEGELVHYLKKNGQQNRTMVHQEPTKDAKKSTLTYRHLKSIDRYHLLEVKLQSGRHHQIRAQLGAIGSPIKGDDKYGFKRSNRDRSIHLHAWKLRFQHPVSQEWEEIVAPLPDDPVWNAFEIK